MLQAFNQHGELVPIWKMTRQEIEQRYKESFYCPSCREQVIIKAGIKNTPHFAHQQKSECVQTGEGSYHENGKKDMFNWLQSQGYHVKLEYYHPQINQRSDIFLQLGKKQIAIEYQCAKISKQEALMRRKVINQLVSSQFGF
ncbi:competence protein CoiA [Gracilibacillus boraciitolerans JCM 21714]|uniref:Competence protein CoiA n=1 Tax=Gracilibacillus boraciitolerans JCM 21714 TaxID=1298598 RepID=W4VLC6_9BACI|nr:competence protein CoiA [Gracilibacillus boraciitolerans JCM 21714]